MGFSLPTALDIGLYNQLLQYPGGLLPNKEVGGGGWGVGLNLTSSLEANLGQRPAKFTK